MIISLEKQFLVFLRVAFLHRFYCIVILYELVFSHPGGALEESLWIHCVDGIKTVGPDLDLHCVPLQL